MLKPLMRMLGLDDDDEQPKQEHRDQRAQSLAPGPPIASSGAMLHASRRKSETEEALDRAADRRE